MTALLLVDVQEDFIDGSLAVPHGNEILPVVDQLLAIIFDRVVASQDYHPPGHFSFASTHGKNVFDTIGEQVLWPDHCVQGTSGANLQLPLEKINKIVQKGTDPHIDSYSAFFDNDKKKSTGLTDYLKAEGIKRLAICGLATDYCVLWTVLDARKEGFEVDVIQEGCRGISPENSERAFKQMEEAGAHLFPTVSAYSRSRS